MRRVDHERAELLAERAHEAHRAQPRGRDAAGRGLALADVVAVEEQDAGTGAGELAGDRQPGEARATDDDVVVAGEVGPVRAALGRAGGHRTEGTANGAITASGALTCIA